MQKTMTTNFLGSKKYKENVSKLNPLERDIWKKIMGKKGVVFLQGKPGMGKTSIYYSIAKKLDIHIIHINLSTSDETDFQFPHLYFSEEYDTHVIQFAVPEWAIIANQKPSLIIFEELNRAPLAVRNAALQPLQERSLGYKFKFNDNVFMCASGNIGEEDNTDVDELDGAMAGRLISVPYDLNIPDWMDWAKDNIHPDILSFIHNEPSYFYRSPDKNSGRTSAYASARSWEYFSNYIIHNYGGGIKLDDKGEVIMNEDGTSAWFPDGGEIDNSGKLVRIWGDYSQYKSDILSDGGYYVGSSISKFNSFMENRTKYTIQDIMDRYGIISSELELMNSSYHAEIGSVISELDLTDLTHRQIDNIASYLGDIEGEQRASVFTKLFDNMATHKNKTKGKQQNPNLKRLCRYHADFLRKLDSSNKQVNQIK